LDNELAGFVQTLRFGNKRDEGIMGVGILYEQTLDGQTKNWEINEKREKRLKSLLQIT
jgi:hypothetical protein